MATVVPFPQRAVPLDHEWRTELLERAPAIVARSIGATDWLTQVTANWWRDQFVEEFGREPAPTSLVPGSAG